MTNNQIDAKGVELKNCPFCGEEPELDNGTDYSSYIDRHYLRINCCFGQTHEINHWQDGKTYAEAYEKLKTKWNTRATATQDEALRVMRDGIKAAIGVIERMEGFTEEDNKVYEQLQQILIDTDSLIGGE